MEGDAGSVDDRRHMSRALELARAGWGAVHPNPLVGAVIVRDGVVVAEGAHRRWGGPHAEVEALRAAGGAARGATLYVTLEPCAHHGKTPPCTDAVLAAGVERVVFAAEDPGAASGGGAARLRASGVRVDGGVRREEARRQNAPFFHALERGRCWVALKYALSLDARIAARAGESTRVSGPEAVADVHRLRAGFDAILVGVGTALADDPLLTARGDVTPRRPPTRVVVDTDARLPPDARLLRTAAEAPVLVLCADDAPAERVRALEAAGVRALPVPRADGGVDLAAALSRLWEQGIRSVLCEGGGRLGAALLSADLVERLWLYVAPRFFGAPGVEAFPEVRGPAAMDGAWRLEEWSSLGGDARLVLDRVRAG